jgi:hypothetical protein
MQAFEKVIVRSVMGKNANIEAISRSVFYEYSVIEETF